MTDITQFPIPTRTLNLNDFNSKYAQTVTKAGEAEVSATAAAADAVATAADRVQTGLDAAAAGASEAAALASLVIQPVNVTGDYTLALTDQSKAIKINSATAAEVTIPVDETADFPVGAVLSVMQVGEGITTISGAAGVTVHAPYGLIIPAQWATAVLHKHAANEWVVLI